ncbi:hypothetical protein N9351_01590 [Candidatus Thioglobus sp.]|nr:hypothetical protein [Candidatus Thioglobus sp.]
MACFQTKSHSLLSLIVLICSLSFNVQSASLQDQFQNKEKQESTKAVDNNKKFHDLLSSSLEDLFKKFEIIIDNQSSGVLINKGESEKFIFVNPYLFSINTRDDELRLKLRKFKNGLYIVPSISVLGKVSEDGSIEFLSGGETTQQFGSWNQTISSSYSTKKDFFYKKGNNIEKGYYYSYPRDKILLGIFSSLRDLKKDDGIYGGKAYDLIKDFQKKHRMVCNDGIKIQEANNQLYQSSSQVRQNFMNNTCY